MTWPVLPAADGVCSTGLSVDGVGAWDGQGAAGTCCGVHALSSPSGKSFLTDGSTTWLPAVLRRVGQRAASRGNTESIAGGMEIARACQRKANGRTNMRTCRHCWCLGCTWYMRGSDGAESVSGQVVAA